MAVNFSMDDFARDLAFEICFGGDRLGVSDVTEILDGITAGSLNDLRERVLYHSFDFRSKNSNVFEHERFVHELFYGMTSSVCLGNRRLLNKEEWVFDRGNMFRLDDGSILRCRKATAKAEWGAEHSFEPIDEKSALKELFSQVASGKKNVTFSRVIETSPFTAYVGLCVGDDGEMKAVLSDSSTLPLVSCSQTERSLFVDELVSIRLREKFVENTAAKKAAEAAEQMPLIQLAACSEVVTDRYRFRPKAVFLSDDGDIIVSCEQRSGEGRTEMVNIPICRLPDRSIEEIQRQTLSLVPVIARTLGQEESLSLSNKKLMSERKSSGPKI